MFRMLLTVTALLVLSGCGEAPADPDAAITIADESISYAELEELLSVFQGDSARIETVVENLINSRMVLIDARNRGLDTLPEIQRYMYEREREQLQGIWLARILEEKVVLPPDTVREFYDQLGTMVVYTVMNVQDSILCDSLRQLALNGTDLGDLVEEYTTIPYDVHIRGSIGPVDRMRMSQGDRELIADLEQGSISMPGLFASGWRFLRVDSMYLEEVEPFEEISEFIGQYILSHLREEYKQVLEDSMRTSLDLTVGEGIPDLVAGHALDDIGEYLPYTDDELSMDAYTFDGGSRTLLSLVENIAALPPMMPRSPTDPEWVEGYCRILGLYDIMAMEGRALGLDTLPEVVYIVERRTNGRILDEYYAQVIDNRLVPTEEELEVAYVENSDMLLIPLKRVFECIGAIGPEQVETLTRIVSLGEEPFSRPGVLTLLTDLTAPEESILTGPITMLDMPSPWDSLLFGANLGETVFCTLSTERILIFRPIEEIPERMATMEEARGQLVELLTTEREEEIVSALVDSLRSVYHYHVDRDFVNGFIIEGEESAPGSTAETQPVPADSQSTD